MDDDSFLYWGDDYDNDRSFDSGYRIAINHSVPTFMNSSSIDGGYLMPIASDSYTSTNNGNQTSFSGCYTSKDSAYHTYTDISYPTSADNAHHASTDSAYFTSTRSATPSFADSACYRSGDSDNSMSRNNSTPMSSAYHMSANSDHNMSQDSKQIPSQRSQDSGYYTSTPIGDDESSTPSFDSSYHESYHPDGGVLSFSRGYNESGHPDGSVLSFDRVCHEHYHLDDGVLSFVGGYHEPYQWDNVVTDGKHCQSNAATSNNFVPHEYSDVNLSTAYFIQSTAHDGVRRESPEALRSIMPFQKQASRRIANNNEWLSPYKSSMDVFGNFPSLQPFPTLDLLTDAPPSAGKCDTQPSGTGVGTISLPMIQGSDLESSDGKQQHVRVDSESPQSSPEAATIAQHRHVRRARSDTTNHIPLSISTDIADGGIDSIGSCDSGTDVLDSMDGFSEDSDFNCASDISAEKEQIIDRLMVCVYDMFASIGSPTHNSRAAHGSSQPASQTDGSPAKASDMASKKRKRRCESGDGNANEEENDGSRKRPKNQVGTDAPDQKNEKFLACPYYKCNPRKSYPSKRCYGPGWHNVARLKEHLYRVHSMPLHCRRCYVQFDNENQLNDHSQMPVSCTIQPATLMEGFSKDQEKALKGRRTMFRAGSEEEKWKIVYLILFPSTAPGKLPSPYYNTYEDSLCERPDDHSPQSFELRHFNVYMNRELPATIRRTLQAAFDRDLVPVEETLRNQLENIVRDVHETLTRNYLDSVQPSDTLSKATAAPVDGVDAVGTWSTANPNVYDSVPSTQVQIDALAPFSIPPDASSSFLPPLLLENSVDTGASFSDSAYYSYPTDTQESSFDESWLKPDPGSESIYESLFGTELPGDSSFEMIAPDLPCDSQPSEQYTGKGKEKADPDSNNNDTQFDFSPWVPDRLL